MNNKTRILLVSAAPLLKNSEGKSRLEKDRPRLEAEREKIRKEIRSTDYRDCIDVDICEAATYKGFITRLQAFKPHVLHFSGHSDENKMYFEDEDGNPDSVDSEVLSNLFDTPTSSVRCVLFNSCSSEELAQSLRFHVEYVIGTSGSINDKQANEFSTIFYNSLGSSASLESAFHSANNAVKKCNREGLNLNPFQEDNEYILYQQENLQTNDPFLQAACIAKVQQKVGHAQEIDPFFHKVISDKAKSATANLSRLQVEKYHEAAKTYKMGYSHKAVQDLIAIRQHPSWEDLDSSTQISTIQSLAIYKAIPDQNVEVLRKAADEILAISPNEKIDLLTVYIALYEKKYDEAKQLLHSFNDIEGHNLTAIIDFQEGKFDDAFNKLCAIPSDIEWTAETHRLSAILELVHVQNLEASRLSINEALKLSPEWESVRGMEAIISFWETCVPAAINEIPALLNPPSFPSVFLRVDDSSAERFKSIAHSFSDLSKLELRDDLVFHYKSWELISRIAANQPEEATNLLTQLFQSRSDISLCILWCQDYGVPFDKKLATDFLLSVTSDDKRYLNYQGIYISLLIEDGHAEEALEKLDALKTVFSEQGRVQSWHFWRSDVFKALGQTEEAKKELQALSKSKQTEASFFSLERSLSDTTEEEYLDQLLEIYDEDGSVLTLYNSCEVAARQERWEVISKHKNILVRSFPIPAVINLVAHAEFALKDPSQALSTLTDYISIFPNSVLPSQLKVLEIRCLTADSRVNEAVIKARLFAEEMKTATSYATLLDVLVITGDSSKIIDTANKFLGLDDAKGDQLLHVSNLMKLLDTHLAKSLWKKAVSEGSDSPEFSISAYHIGEALNAGEENISPLLRKAMEQASNSDSPLLKSISFKELIEFMGDRKEVSKENVAKYMHGEVPVHVVPKGALQPLSVLFHTNSNINQDNYDPAYSVPIWVRHGGRPLNLKVNAPSGAIYLDYTALIVAEQVGVLDLVIKAFSGIKVPHNTQQFLLSEIEELSPVQPKQLEVIKKLKQLVKEEAIELVDLDEVEHKDLNFLVEKTSYTTARELITAKDRDGLVVDYLPLKDHENEVSIRLPNEWHACVTNVSSIIEDLHNNDLLIGDYEQIIKKFHDGSDDSKSYLLPIKKQPLVISATILLRFAKYDLLDTITRRYSVICHSDGYKNYLAELEHSERLNKTVKWLRVLKDKVSDGITSGEVSLIPDSRDTREDTTLLLEGLSNILTHSASIEDVVWIDDRHMTGYPFMSGGCQVVSCIDILMLLKNKKEITREQYYRCIIKLRECNYRYIPLSKEEILFWLRKTKDTNKGIVESRELRVIRQYWNGCLWSNDFLLPWQNIPKGQTDEVSFILQGREAVTEAIAGTWKNKRLSLNRQKNRSQWLLDNLYVGMFNMKGLPEKGKLNILDLVSLDISSLLLIALDLSPPQKDKRGGNSPQSLYINWINDYFIEPRLKADPQCIATVVRSMTTFFAELLPSVEAVDERYKLITRACIVDLVFNLPNRLKDAFLIDEVNISRLGLPVKKTLLVGELTFERSLFVDAIGRALDFKTTELQCFNESQVMTMCPVEHVTPLQSFSLTPKGKGETTEYGLARQYQILSKSRDIRLQLLNDSPDIVDSSEKNIAAIESELAATENLSKRIDLLDELMNASAEFHFIELKNTLDANHQNSTDVLLPTSLKSLQTYFRIKGDIDFTTSDWNDEWQKKLSLVLDKRGYFELLGRVICLPIPISENLRGLLLSLPNDEMEELLLWLEEHANSPLSKLHALDISLMLSSACSSGMESAQRVLDYFSSSHFIQEFRLYSLILSNTSIELGIQMESSDVGWYNLTLAAWGHTSKVLNLLLAHNLNAQLLIESLTQQRQYLKHDFYQSSFPEKNECLDPDSLRSVNFEYHSVGAILSWYPEQSKALCNVPDLKETLVGSTPTEYKLGYKFVDIICSPEFRSDLVGCFWGVGLDLSLKPFVSDKTAEGLSYDSLCDLAEISIQKIADNPLDESNWFNFHQILGYGHLNNTLTNTFNTALEQVKFNTLFDQSPSASIIWMGIVIRHMDNLDAVLGCLLHVTAQYQNDVFPVRTENDNFNTISEQMVPDLLLKWGLDMARKEGSVEEMDQKFVSIMSELLGRSSKLAKNCRLPFTFLSRSLAYEKHAHLHSLPLLVRSRP